MSRRDQSIGWRSVLAILSVAVAAAVTITVIADQSLFDDATAQPQADVATVRISALKSESGAVRVALQQRESSGSWGDRQHPDLNTVRETALTGVWLNSSPLQLASAVSDPGLGEGAGDAPLFCVVSHGSLDDYFWRLLRGYVKQAEIDLNANVRFVSSLEGAKQAAAIDQCREDGAAVIASTLADPEAVSASLLAAKEAGANIVTFNSGPEFADAVGSEIHISLDDLEAGRLSGQTFNRHGVTGSLICVIHEAQNVGLENRCDTLEQAYEGGDIVRLRLPDGASSDEVIATLSKEILAPEANIRGILTLNGDTLIQGFTAIQQTREQLRLQSDEPFDVQIGSVGQSLGIVQIPIAERNRHLLFVISPLMEAQGYMVVAAMQMVHIFHSPPAFRLNAVLLNLKPFVFNSAGIRLAPDETRQMLANLQRMIAAGEEE